MVCLNNNTVTFEHKFKIINDNSICRSLYAHIYIYIQIFSFRQGLIMKFRLTLNL